MRQTARVYFDNAATTPIDPRVREAMEPFLAEAFGNPSSLHREGRRARQAVDEARKDVADLVGAKPGEVVFTSSGSESDNTAILGTIRALSSGCCHIITSSIEHPAVLEACRALRRHGVDATYLPVTQEGSIDPDTLLKSITARTKLISIMAANNITGALQPIRQLGRIAKERGILFHTDAVQAAGKIPLDMEDDCIDLLSISSHKIHGPKGVGALVIRDGIKIDPLIHGGGQENGRRSSTENVAGIAGFAKAAQISLAEMNEEAARLVNLRERIIEGVTRLVPGSYLIGQRYRRLPGHACFGFNGLEGETIKMLLGLDDAGFAVSTGSACSSHKASEPSYVLTAMGLDPFRARGSLRISLGRFNTDDEVQRFLDVFPGIVSCLNPIFTRA